MMRYSLMSLFLFVFAMLNAQQEVSRNTNASSIIHEDKSVVLPAIKLEMADEEAIDAARARKGNYVFSAQAIREQETSVVQISSKLISAEHYQSNAKPAFKVDESAKVSFNDLKVIELKARLIPFD
ncbi:MAG: hypothetical protein ACK4GL_09705 [Flavobacteriales bacterium]